MTFWDKDRFIEFLKYDYNNYKYPLVLLAKLIVWVLKLLGKHELAFAIVNGVFRTGWSGSYIFGLEQARYYFREHSHIGQKVVEQYIQSIQPLPNTQKFFDEPLAMLDGVVTVLKDYSDNEKGAIIIKYSYYFPLFIRFFDIKKVSNKFHIILEPSWAGYCDLNLLSYVNFDFPIFVQSYEKRDRKFLEDLNSNLKTVDVGPSWFINHENFTVPNSAITRDIDVIMVAAWAKYKRHKEFFRAIRPLLDNKPDLNIYLIGYPVDQTKDDILQIVSSAGFENNVTILEWITPEEVAQYQKRAKVNVLWSKFEGNNRAIIEGLFSDTPVILRKGHNYGEHYDFINPQTGTFALEDNVAEKISEIINCRPSGLSPRSYVLNNRSCFRATDIMGQTISRWERENADNTNWKPSLAIKVNELHGMKYFRPDEVSFGESYSFLKKHKI